MANLQEVVSWEAGIYQLETGDPVLGGPGGVSNKQGQALANRTAYLKKHVDDIEGGNTAAGKADKLSTARNIALAGDVTGQAAFDGSGNITITATYKNSGVVAGTYRSVTVDAKGNITAGTNPTTLAGYGITDAVPASQKGANNGVATLDGGGKVPVSQLPATAIIDTFVVGSQAAMLALTAEIGDVAVRTDLNKSFILRVTGASTLANWQELLTPTDTVQSVDGMTGAVTIPTASEAVKGKAQIATEAEVNAGTDDTKFVTAKKLLAWVKQASETVLGMMKVATKAQVDAATDDTVAVTPKKLANHYKKSNIVGPVSLAQGVPSGAIIEYGRNANGYYVKYADGSVSCEKIIAANTLWTFPVAMLNVHAINVTADGTGPLIATYDSLTNSNANLNCFNMSGQEYMTNVSAKVSGRWAAE